MASQTEHDPVYMESSVRVFNAIKTYLKEKDAPFRTVHHQPTFTSDESAKARGEDISVGGKAIVMKLDETFKLFVLSASKRIDSKKIKSTFGCKKVRFASADELKTLTGLVPGCVPPFGESILPFELNVDDSVLVNEKIAFNAGSLTDSLIMKVEDYMKACNCNQFNFSE